MPINPLPFILIYVAILAAIFVWSRKAGGIVALVSAMVLVVFYINTGVEKSFQEDMPYGLIHIGGYTSIQLTNSHGDTISLSSPRIVQHLEKAGTKTAHVSMKCWYDFGKLRAYNFQEIDGAIPDNM